MKKIFLFAAAAIAALTVNAASFVGFSAIDSNLGLQIMNDNLIQNKVNVDVAQAASFDPENPKYEIKLVTGGTEGSFSMGGVVFAYTNSADGAVAYKTYGTYIQPNGKDRSVRIPAKQGEQVKIYLTEACAGVLVDEVSTDFVAGENVLTATKNGIELKTVSTKPKFQAILPAEGQGFENAGADVKVEKFYRDGQLIIRKNGVEYNALGAKL